MHKPQQRERRPSDRNGDACHQAKGGRAGDAGQQKQHRPRLAAFAVQIGRSMAGNIVEKEAVHG